MVNSVKQKLDEIINTCKQMNVEALYLVGSASRETDFTPNSDIDFLFRMKMNAEGMYDSEYDYFDLWFKLEEITGRKVDLIAETGIRNQVFLKNILQDKVKIYEA
jgi:uncharacterized protein